LAIACGTGIASTGHGASITSSLMTPNIRRPRRLRDRVPITTMSVGEFLVARRISGATLPTATRVSTGPLEAQGSGAAEPMQRRVGNTPAHAAASTETPTTFRARHDVQKRQLGPAHCRQRGGAPDCGIGCCRKSTAQRTLVTAPEVDGCWCRRTTNVGQPAPRITSSTIEPTPSASLPFPWSALSTIRSGLRLRAWSSTTLLASPCWM
jgi:hypothetical protein